ncbi:hypothetical protein BDW69DRAFT_163768 [Aspergillus filifer]
MLDPPHNVQPTCLICARRRAPFSQNLCVYQPEYKHAHPSRPPLDTRWYAHPALCFFQRGRDHHLVASGNHHAAIVVGPHHAARVGRTSVRLRAV